MHYHAVVPLVDGKVSHQNLNEFRDATFLSWDGGSWWAEPFRDALATGWLATHPKTRGQGMCLSSGGGQVILNAPQVALRSPQGWIREHGGG